LCLFTLFETQITRQAFQGAEALCLEVLSDGELLGNERLQIRKAWQEMLFLARERARGLEKLHVCRQYLLRCWHTKTPWERFEVGTIAQVEVVLLDRDPPISAPGEAVEAVAFPSRTAKGAKEAEEYHRVLDSRKKELFEAVVISCGYSVRGTARALGISRN